MIEIDDLTFGYRKGDVLFSDLNLHLQKGKVYGLLGKNGSGKTTLLKQMAGLLSPWKGNVRVEGYESSSRNLRILEKYFFLPEEFYLPNLNINEFVKVNASFYKSFDKEKFNNYINEFQLPAKSNLQNMSYGQKKKMLISFALATETPILFSDEPTNGLDIPSKTIFRQIMAHSITDNRLFIISTHQVGDLHGLIDAVVVLNDGKIIFNEDLDRVSEILCFKTMENIENEDVLFYQQNFYNYNVITKNKDNNNSLVDLELLFTALISDKSYEIQKLFN